MNRLILGAILWLCLLSDGLNGQPYESWRLGSGSSIDTEQQSGLVLAGGGADNDEAMKWMLQRAQGGDVVIIRTSGSNGYNSYFFSELGITLNSVETLRINSREGANDPYVAQRIREAEVLFIAGGDQTTYFDLWHNTGIHDAIDYLIHEKRVTVGGTSAGMAILSEFYYIPQELGILSSEALANPFHRYINTIGQGNFIQIPLLSNTITDTHFDDRNRSGRLMTMMARMEWSFEVSAKGIACNERTAVCIDEQGNARVFGRDNRTDTYAYFLQSNCDRPQSIPEVCAPNTPLTWNHGGEAVKVYRIKGDDAGTHTFNLNTWNEGSGGEWWDWSVTSGTLNTKPGTGDLCKEATSTTTPKVSSFNIHPNPFRQDLIISQKGENQSSLPSFQVFNTQGILIHTAHPDKSATQHTVHTAHWPTGTYTCCFLEGRDGKGQNCIKILKVD